MSDVTNCMYSAFYKAVARTRHPELELFFFILKTVSANSRAF